MKPREWEGLRVVLAELVDVNTEFLSKNPVDSAIEKFIENRR